MSTLNVVPLELDFVELAWQNLDKRTRYILELRLLEFTLEEISYDLELTRERVRQLEKTGQRLLNQQMSSALSFLPAKLDQIAAPLGAMRISAIQDVVKTECLPGTEVFLQSIGFQRLRVWGQGIPGWWTKDSTSILASLNSVTLKAPFDEKDLADIGSTAQIPAHFPLAEALKAPGSGVLQDNSGYWIRRKSKSADSAYLWLSKQVEPAAAEDIAMAIGAVSTRALSEVMRRNEDRFIQIRPEGTWALREWNHVVGTEYKDTTEAVLDVLYQLGPLTLQQLTSETIRRYPVTPWRVGQCVFSSDVGQMADGRYDLIQRGVPPLIPHEPFMPNYVAVSGNVIAVKLPVNTDLLRGSGMGVSIWLTWKLGLHTYPAKIEFAAVTPVTVRRHSSGASISSLRNFSQEIGLQKGCSIVVVFNTSTMMAKIRHGCNDSCPNGAR